jgi:hypothetical protein
MAAELKRMAVMEARFAKRFIREGYLLLPRAHALSLAYLFLRFGYEAEQILRAQPESVGHPVEAGEHRRHMNTLRDLLLLPP